MNTRDYFREEMEKITWKHYDSEAALSVEDMLDEMIPLVREQIAEAKKEERFRLIDRGCQSVALFLDGPLRDSAFAIFEELKTVVFDAP